MLRQANAFGVPWMKSGAGGAGAAVDRMRHVALVKRMIGAMNRLTTELTGVTDEASSRAAAAKIKEAGAELQALKNVADALPPLGNGEDDRLKEEFSKSLTDAASAFQSQAVRIASSPTLLTLELKAAFESLSQLK